MWRNLPFFLLWVLGCLQRLCPSQGSWSSREESHALCWVWWPRYKRRVGVHADPSGHFFSFPSASLGERKSQLVSCSTKESTREKLWEIQWNVVELRGSSVRVKVVAGGRCSACWVSWFNFCRNTGSPWTLHPTDHVQSEHSPQTRSCASNTALFPNKWRFLGNACP